MFTVLFRGTGVYRWNTCVQFEAGALVWAYTFDDYPVISLWLFDGYSLLRRQPAIGDDLYCSAEQVEHVEQFWCFVLILVYTFDDLPRAG